MEPNLQGQEREIYENEIRMQGNKNFKILEWNADDKAIPARSRPEYVVVTYVEPENVNSRSLGFDVMAIRNRRKALIRARDTGTASATGRLLLIQEMDRQPGFIIYLPVYKNGLSYRTLQDRRKNLQGYIAGVFRINDMLEAILQNTDRDGIEISIRDESAVGFEQLFYRQNDSGKKLIPDYLQRDISMDMAGRSWVVHFSLSPNYLLTHKSLQAWSF